MEEHRHVHLHQENIYGDKYDIHDNPGAVFNFGSMKADKVKKGSDEPPHEEVDEMSKLEIALQAVAEMAREGAFKPQKNYISAYRIVEELYANGMETAEFCRLMEKKTDLTAELLPKNDNFRKIYFEKKQKYPNWSFPQEGAEFTQDMVDLARTLQKKIRMSDNLG